MDFWLWLPALLAGLLVIVTHVPLGQIVLKKEVIFLDLAIAQAAALGVSLAHVLAVSPDSFQWHALAGISAILMAVLFQYLDKRKNRYLEAWIGCSFVLTASLGLWLVANSPHAAEQLKETLMGQILWVTPHHLWVTLAYYVLAMLVWWIWRHQFYVVFALCITASVQLVGVYLVFATLIMPALTMASLGYKKVGWVTVMLGYIFALLAYVVGISLSHFGDWPASLMIIFALSIMMFCILFMSRYLIKK